MTNPKPARTRFAPSPTGRFHIGGARTALYDYLLAKQTGGQFILRIEDTDQKRYVPGAEEEIMHGLRWLGLQWDEGPDIGGPFSPYRQSERKEIYLDYAKQLIQRGAAYRCFCSPQRLAAMRAEQQARKESIHYDGTCRNIDPDEAEKRAARGEPNVIRFKMPKEGTIIVHDELRGAIQVENQNLDDYILVKSDGLALYHLACIVDDHLMNITHVLRGSEWLSTFPLHSHIYRAFGWEEPQWIHLSVFLKPSGKGKMSKRDAAQMMQDGFSIFVTDLKEMGYLPEAVNNWIALMGWGITETTTDSPISSVYSLDEMIQLFNIKNLNPSAAAINISKMDYFNGEHIRRLSIQDLTQRLVPFFAKAGFDMENPNNLHLLQRIVPIIQIRITTLDDAIDMAGFFFRADVHPIREQLIAKNLSSAESAEAAKRAYEILSQLPEINPQTAEQPLRSLAEELNISVGQLFGILRVAVTGQPVSPPLLESMEIIGKETVLQRIENAIKLLEGN